VRLCEGCKAVPVKKYSKGYCPACFNRVRKCSDDGCENWLSAVNRSGWCTEHAVYGRKLKRMALAEARDQERQQSMEKMGGRRRS
jgi:hypothetical protein